MRLHCEAVMVDVRRRKAREVTPFVGRGLMSMGGCDHAGAQPGSRNRSGCDRRIGSPWPPPGGMLDPLTPHGPAAGRNHFRFLGVGRCKPYFHQSRYTRLLVQRPALASEHPVGHPTAPANVVGGDLAETTPQLGILQVDDLAGVALGAAVLAHHPAGQAFRGPVKLLRNHDCPAKMYQAQKFSVAP